VTHLKPTMDHAFTIVFALFPQITQLDFTGPHEILWRAPQARCMLASGTGGRVQAAGGLSFDTIPIETIDRCDMLVVPGGHGVLDAMNDAKLLSHLRRLSHDASHVVSICTGSLLLGAAGLLAGRRSACHWAWRDLLSEFPDVTPDPGRVVHDGKYWTSGGVTSGIDVALSVLAEVVDGDFAQSVQLTVEYAPAPPFEAGRPESAPAHVLKFVKERLAESGNARLEAVRHAASLLVDHHSAVLDSQLSTRASDVLASTAQTPHQH